MILHQGFISKLNYKQYQFFLRSPLEWNLASLHSIESWNITFFLNWYQWWIGTLWFAYTWDWNSSQHHHFLQCWMEFISISQTTLILEFSFDKPLIKANERHWFLWPLEFHLILIDPVITNFNPSNTVFLLQNSKLNHFNLIIHDGFFWFPTRWRNTWKAKEWYWRILCPLIQWNWPKLLSIFALQRLICFYIEYLWCNWIPSIEWNWCEL